MAPMLPQPFTIPIAAARLLEEEIDQFTIHAAQMLGLRWRSWD